MDIDVVLFLFMVGCTAIASLSNSEHLKIAFAFSTAGTGILLFRGSATWPIALAVFMLAHSHYALSALRHHQTRFEFLEKKRNKLGLILLYILLCAICLAFSQAVLYPVAALYAGFLLTHAGVALWKGNFFAKIGALAFVGCDICEFLRQAMDIEWWWAWVFFGPSMFFLSLSGFPKK